MSWNALYLRIEIAAEFARFAHCHSDLVGYRFYTLSHRVTLWARPPLACASCGIEFVPLHGLRLFCSLACKRKGGGQLRAHKKYALRRTAQRLERRKDKRCANPRCGAVFTATRSDAVYCSFACGARAKSNRHNQRKRCAGSHPIELEVRP